MEVPQPKKETNPEGDALNYAVMMWRVAQFLRGIPEERRERLYEAFTDAFIQYRSDPGVYGYNQMLQLTIRCTLYVQAMPDDNGLLLQLSEGLAAAMAGGLLSKDHLQQVIALIHNETRPREQRKEFELPPFPWSLF
jgi:hypothetical protein